MVRLASGLLLFAVVGITAAQQLTGQSEWVHGDPEGLRGLKAAVPPPADFSSIDSASTCTGERQICIDRGIGLWVEQNNGNSNQTNTAEFDYRPENNGFTLVYNNEQLADVATTWDSPPYEWPIIRSEFAYRGACACCDLCRAQPNPSSAETAAKCKEWSYRPTDRVCRLFINNPGQNQASVALNSTTEYQRNFTSGEAPKVNCNSNEQGNLTCPPAPPPPSPPSPSPPPPSPFPPPPSPSPPPPSPPSPLPPSPPSPSPPPPSPSPPPPHPSPPPPAPSPPPPGLSPPPPSPSPPPPSPSPPPPSPSLPSPSPSPPPPSPSPPPPSPSPPPPSPTPNYSKLTFQLTCPCGFIKKLEIGLVPRGGKQFASRINITCSDGSVVQDPTSLEPFTRVTGPICNASSTVGSGQYKGACLSMTTQYDLVLGQQADTKLGKAGRVGTSKVSTPACPNGKVLVGLSPSRFFGPGVPPQLNFVLTNIIPQCGKPRTACTAPPPRKSPPPPKKQPPPPPPKPHPNNEAVRKECSCGYVKSLEVGFILVSGKTYASRMNVRCSNGQVLKDTTTTTPTTWQNTSACVPGAKVTTGPNAGACRSVLVKYETVQGFQAITGVVNAGRAGTASTARTCATGVVTGIGFQRYSPSPTFNALNGVMHALNPSCGPPKPCPAPGPPPPVKKARGWGDPHFKGFDGVDFEFRGVPGNWYEVLGSTLPVLSIRTQVQASTRVAGHTFMRAFELRINGAVIIVKLLPPEPAKPAVWRLVAIANGQRVGSTLTLANGIKIDRVAGDIGKFGTVKVNAGFIFISCIQKWRPARNELADFLDINIILYNHLRLPVTGILGPSYERALRSQPITAAAGTGLRTPLSAASQS